MFSTERMSAVFSSRSRVEAMLRFEAALARAEARAGVVPVEAAEAIARTCDADRFDPDALEAEARMAGNPAIPLVRALTEAVPAEAQGYVHWGATSQDVIDTGLVLQVRDGLDALVDDLLRVGQACASLAERHVRTPMVGRTLLQHALPTTFGLKAARWLTPVTRELRRLRVLRASLPLQFGGAVGTLAALGEDGPRVRELLGEDLGLAVPDMPWHTDRGPVAEVAAAVGMVAGTVGKIATDVVLLSQSEVGEVAEGRAGPSSTMPQKRNPVHAPTALAAARLALGTVPVILSGMVQEHERAAGAWQAEWSAVPELFRTAAAAVGEAAAALEGLQVDEDRMRANLDAGGGQVMAEALMMALAPKVGRHQAYAIVADAVDRARREGLDLADAVAEDERARGVADPEAVRAARDPLAYLGSAEGFVRRALEAFRGASGGMDRGA